MERKFASDAVRMQVEKLQADDLAKLTTRRKKSNCRTQCRCAPGVGDLEVYFDPAVAMEEKIIFSKYVHEHLLQHARDVERGFRSPEGESK